ncbi:MAG: hypothetical protein WCQ99_04290 [Pseudomonadota bacterium]
MNRPLKIVVAGYAIAYPLGGQVWMMLHYLLGLSRMGHEVLFLEDSSNWSYPFNPLSGDYAVDSTYGRLHVEQFFSRFGLSGRWAYYSEFEHKLYGWEQDRLDRFCGEADLLLNISGVNPLRETYLRCRVKAIIDTDPVFTQIKIADDAWTRNYYKAHDVCFTYGCNLPAGTTGVPLGDINWKPLLPPVALDQWAPLENPGQGYTTIGSWDTKGRDVVLNGKQYSWRKSIKYDPLCALPSKLPGIELGLTFSGMNDNDRRLFARHGWVVRDAAVLSRDLWAYRDYIRSSRAEFTVAKDQNVQLKSGWFSDRSASYLAAGRPVITENTGFGDYLPVGEGLFAFNNQDDILAAIASIEADPVRHSRAARRIAEEYFDASTVLARLLRETGLA